MKLKTLLQFLLTSFALVAFSHRALCQSTAIPQTTSIQKGKFSTTDGYSITFFSLTMDEKVYKYQVKKDGPYKEISADKIIEIQKETGNKALLYGASFGAAGLLGSLLGVEEANSSTTGLSNTSANKIEVPLVIGSTAIFGLIGILIGEGQKKYSTIYHNSKWNSSIIPNLHINLVLNNNLKNVGIQYVF